MQATSDVDSPSQAGPWPEADDSRGSRLVERAWTIIGILALAGAAYLGVTDRESHRLSSAQRQSVAGNVALAAKTAARVRGQGADAALVAALALQRADDLPGAQAALRRAIDSAPNRWELHRQLAIVLQALGERSDAQSEMRAALRLNPMLVLPPGFKIDR